MIPAAFFVTNSKEEFMLNGKTPRKDIEVQWYADRKMTVTDEI